MSLEVLLKYHKLFPQRKLNVLRSFGMLDNQNYDYILKHKDKVGSLILDSGTWSLNNAKMPSPGTNLSNYIRFVTLFGSYFDFYFNFDSDFSNSGFGNNLGDLLEMKKAGLDPVPVVHDIFGSEIGYYIKNGYKRVALGSKQITTLDDLEYAMNKFQGTGIKIHLFGNARFDFLTKFPIYSADTGEWVHMGKYGHILYWNPKKEEVNKTDKIYLEEYLQRLDKKKVTLSNYEFREDLEKYLDETLGITYRDLLSPGNAYTKMLVNTHYYAQLEDAINRIHQQNGFRTN